jgi:CRISPR/Cas system-associated exonuclease Cas4 (RecB family)
LIWSYSVLNKFLQCPHEAWHRYVLKDVPYAETPQMELGNEVHTALENRLKGKPLPREYDRYEFFAQPLGRYEGIQPEMKLGVTAKGVPCSFFADDVWGRGKIDVPIVVGDSAVILDWKTGKVWEDPFELQVQAVLLKAHYPNLERIVGSYVWLADSRVGVIYDLTDTQKTWEKINRIMDEVGHRKKMGVWEKKPGKLCSWCPVKSCEHNTCKT